MSEHLLLIEDEVPVREMLRLLFEDNGFVVNESGSGEDGLARFDDRQTDLVILDLRLPGMHGFDVLRTLRRSSDVPIVIVTAQVDSHDVVAGLEAGADDYVTKPFVTRELIARVRATLRRSSVGAVDDDQPLSFGELEIRPREGTAHRRGRVLKLTKTEFLLLCHFARNAGSVLTREQLLENVWGFDYIGDSRMVDAHVHRLRTKIEPDPSRPVRLVTVRGLGYRFEREAVAPRDLE